MPKKKPTKEKEVIGEKLMRKVPKITKGKTPIKRDGKGGKTMPDKFETVVEPNLDLVSAWIRDGLNTKQIAENLGISKYSLTVYKTRYPQFGEMFKKDKQRLDLVHMVNAYQRRAEGYTTIELEREYKVFEDGTRQLVREKERERHIPGDARALEHWINLRMADDPMWGKLREVIHDHNIESAAEGGLVFIPQKRKASEEEIVETVVKESVVNGDDMETTAETRGVHEPT